MGITPFLWWEDLRAETLPELDLLAIRNRGDFSSDVLRRSDELAADPAVLKEFLGDRLGQLQRGGVARATEPLALEESEGRVLQEATHLALALLAGRESS